MSRVYSVAISENSVLPSKISKQINMNILDITAEYLDIKTEYIYSRE